MPSSTDCTDGKQNQTMSGGSGGHSSHHTQNLKFTKSVLQSQAKKSGETLFRLDKKQHFSPVFGWLRAS